MNNKIVSLKDSKNITINFSRKENGVIYAQRVINNQYKTQDQLTLQDQKLKVISTNQSEQSTYQTWKYLLNAEKIAQRSSKSVQKMQQSRINYIQESNTVAVGPMGLLGGLGMDSHLNEDRKFRVYINCKNYLLPTLKGLLGIFTVIYDNREVANNTYSTVAIGGWSLILEGISDLLREYFENIDIPGQVDTSFMARFKSFSLFKNKTQSDQQQSKLKRDKIIYILKYLPGQFILAALEVYIVIEVFKTSLELDQVSSLFEMILIFVAALLCFFENFSQVLIRIFVCKTYHGQNHPKCQDYQYKFKPISLVFVSMALCITFVFMATEDEQSEFFPTLAIYMVSDGINQLMDNKGDLVLEQMKHCASQHSADDRVHQASTLSDVVSFNKYLSGFQVITSVLLIMPVRFMDDKYAAAEMVIFILLLLMDAFFNFMDSYYYKFILLKNNKGLDKYLEKLDQFEKKQELELEKAVK